VSIDLVMINRYVDFNDYENPIKEFLDDTFYWVFVPSLKKLTNIYVKKNLVTLYDDILQIFGGVTNFFYQVDNFKDFVESVDHEGELLAVYIREDKYYDTYDRKVYNFLQFLSDLGGV